MVFGTCDGLNSPPIVIRWTLSSYPGPKQKELCIYPQAGNLIFPKLLQGLPLTHFNHQLQPITAQSLEGKALPLTQLRVSISEAYLGPVRTILVNLGRLLWSISVLACPEISVNEWFSTKSLELIGFEWWRWYLKRWMLIYILASIQKKLFFTFKWPRSK